MKNIQHKIKLREIACNVLYRSLKRAAYRVPTAVNKEAGKQASNPVMQERSKQTEGDETYVTAHTETLEGHFSCFPTMCETQPSLENCSACFFSFSFSFEDARAPRGTGFLEMSMAVAEIFPAGLCL